METRILSISDHDSQCLAHIFSTPPNKINHSHSVFQWLMYETAMYYLHLQATD